MDKEYALYKGENQISFGTLEEIAEDQGVKKDTIYFYSTPTYERRRRNSKNKNYRTVICLDD